MSYKYKQAIIIRKDLKMRRGKEIAQGAHASLSAFLKSPDTCAAWLENGQAKITLQVSSEVELQALTAIADVKDVSYHLIVDRGYTEFHGVPTITALAIGPDTVEKIDAITAGLNLY